MLLHKENAIHGYHNAAALCISTNFLYYFIVLLTGCSSEGITADFAVSPVKKWALALSYYLSTLFSTLIICFLATGAGLWYLSTCGWFLSYADVLYIILDVFLLSMFGTALSSIIYAFLSTQGQISAVTAIISSCYGFICGAYMPISSFGDGLQSVLSFLPCTYGTSLIKNHTLGGVFAEMERQSYPAEVIDGMKQSLDCEITLMDNVVTINQMYLILGGTVALCVAAYVTLVVCKSKKSK